MINLDELKENLLKEEGLALQCLIRSIGDTVKDKRVIHPQEVVPILNGALALWLKLCEENPRLNPDALIEFHKTQLPAIYRLWRKETQKQPSTGNQERGAPELSDQPSP